MPDVLDGLDCIRGELIGKGKINVLKNCYYGPEPSDPATGLLWRSNVDELLRQWNGATWDMIGPDVSVNWTPTISFGGAAVGVTYNAALTLGRYSLKGNWLFFSGRLTLTDKGSSNGNVLIESLPYTVKNYEGATSACPFFANKVSFANQIQAFVTPNTNEINIYEVTEGGVLTSITDAEFEDDSDIIFSGMYEIEV